nr:unnamed protein product [Callosobruchus analis]
MYISFVIDNRSRVYTIKPKGAEEPFQAPCDFETDGGGWTIIQRREDGSVNFSQNYETYKNGFGNLGGEFWLGLEKIHQMTETAAYELLILMTDSKNVTRDARYIIFKVGSEATGYVLSVGGLSGDGDILQRSNNQKFSALDKDQDSDDSRDCAKERGM